ncbi:unnamed protein product [Notodromas monacha]|uniref:UDP-N-acetylglucosamine diphosphorylase n=1 Tax=Notodromas monacha TaxID=399045 RepID=A0A7R9BBG2_9CRUS|nr:unnamed protein product [Notodromas monacha]CAG0912221.1 unnamed protein product [Notodromas monacha]
MEAMRDYLLQHGQEHLLRVETLLSEDEKENLLSQINSIDIPKMVTKFRQSLETFEHASSAQIDVQLKPPTNVLRSVTRTSAKQLEEFRERGLLEIAEGRVGVALLAGGQGTRLGVNYPKGMYDVDLPSHKTLYQIQAERILRLQTLAERKHGKQCSIPWYIMTSGHTKEPTLQFFRKHNFFGLKPDNVIIFNQGQVPCFSFDGKIMLEAKGRIACSPDGNGGLYRALRQEGILQSMRDRRLSCVHVYCVDNILVKVADPVFIGYCLTEGADCGAKVVPKAHPEEPVGVVCEVNGKYQVVEYSEITSKTAQKRTENGELLFNAANICNHFFTVDFLERASGPLEDKLEYHVAKKKIPCAGEDGGTMKPSIPNGIKIEKFVFDVFQFSEKFRLWEVRREEDFSPVKNADGAATDTPTTAREMYYSLCQSYVEKAGGRFGTGESEAKSGVVEISPLISYDGEGLESFVKGQCFSYPVLF